MDVYAPSVGRYLRDYVRDAEHSTTTLARGCSDRLPGCELFDPQYLMAKGEFFRPVSKKGIAQMAWKAPKIVEVSVGMEINMYMCAARK